MTVRIYVPGDAAAQSVGANAVAKAVETFIKTRGLDAVLVRNGSRGLLWLEPLLEIETAAGRIGYGPVTPGDVKDILGGGVDGDHPLKLGKVGEIPYLAKQQRLTFARCGLTDPLSLEEYEANGGLKGLRRALEMAPADIVQQVIDSGLRGRGGAGFPTGIKWRTVLQTESPRKYIVCNADEGDSGTFSDRMLMEGDPFTLIEGMAIAGVATKAEKGFVYIRSEYPHAFRQFSHAIEIAREKNLIGRKILGSEWNFDLEARLGAGAYICGEETSLLDDIDTGLTMGQWHHVVATFNNGTTQHYIDGHKDPVTIVNNNWVSPLESTVGQPLNFGNRHTALNRNFPGYIGKIRAYNVVLTDDEAYKVFAEDSVTRGLVGKWDLNEGSGTTATDTSGNSNNGTISNATWVTFATPKYAASLAAANGDSLLDGAGESLVSNDASRELTTGRQAASSRGAA